MAKTFVITGATDGIGAAVTRALFLRGEHVVIIGRDAQKGEQLVRKAASTPGSASFIQTDLSLVANTKQVIAELIESYPKIDGLVMCARYMRMFRNVTSEGFEHNFALFYLSRTLFSYGLLSLLERAEHPVIINVAGPGHDTPITWDDLQSAREYDGVRAMFLPGRLNDLLGVTFAERHGHGPVRYVLFHPGTTATSFAGEYDAQTAAHLERQKVLAKPATAVVPPIVSLLDNPPEQPLSAFHLDEELDIHSELFSPELAARLATITKEILNV
ncbi:SDR family NAD(P)-dependent oxidoreductase [Ktedonosporobacter rubrisoli]|uniref:SDR family NAD(P)-dependent oxidoreductase n=1 Tax=Ktedonosporobacter rubrisoli TaxID=2509675 RepID=A0A4P6JKK4_KTERU|nr:SDR family NAD(P)-dependent oxidoreductase [Ktedonosporobacter rubrisoli]QBD75685.1 SDR family NAD(P)-dependent oxidoreductase [Ktedonosporobacter rubrisoli]